MEDAEIEKALLAYLMKKGFKHTELVLLEEHSKSSSTSRTDPDVANRILSISQPQNLPSCYQEGYRKLRSWSHGSLDLYKHDLLRVLYLVFIHSFMELIAKGYLQEARNFFSTFREDHEMLHTRDLQKLEGVYTPEHLKEMEFAHTLRHCKAAIKICQYSYDILLQYLHKTQSITMLGIINEHINFQVTSGEPSSISDEIEIVTLVPGSQDTMKQINQKEVHCGLLEDSFEERSEKVSTLALEKADGEIRKGDAEDNKKKQGETGKQGNSDKKLKKDKLGSSMGRNARTETNSTPAAPQVKPELTLPLVPPEVEDAILEDLRNRVYAQGENGSFHSEHTLGSDVEKNSYMLFQGDAGPIYSTTFSPYGDFVLTSSSDSTTMDLSHHYLDGNADVVEFCPHESLHHILATATYTLQEDGQRSSRRGSIDLFAVRDDVGLQLIHRVETAGIFDLRWNPVGTNRVPLLGQADADGCVRVYEFNLGCFEDQETMLKEIAGEGLSSSMCLYLDWDPTASFLSVGHSDGCVSILSFSEAKLHTLQSWKAHEFEVWTTCFDIHQSHMVYTGSDDCKLMSWDLREGASNLVFQNSKAHKMGVCCIAKSPSDPNSLLTGSYDEFLRVWDLRSTLRPVSEKSICLGGGVWRIKFHPTIEGLILAACMHNGFAIVNIGGEGVEVVETYNKHGSLAYGVDWQRGNSHANGKKGRQLVATCSFYDRLLRLWEPKSTRCL